MSELTGPDRGKEEDWKKHEVVILRQQLSSYRSIVWAIYEYSLFRDESFSKHLHSLIGQRKFYCQHEELDLCLKKSLNESFWKDDYNTALPITILAISRLDALAEQLKSIQITIANHPNDYLDKLCCHDWSVVELLLLFVFWMMAQDRVCFLPLQASLIELFAALLQLRILFVVVTTECSKELINLEELIKDAKSFFQVPVALKRIPSLVNENERIKNKFENVLLSLKKRKSYVSQNMVNDLTSLCNCDLNGVLFVKQKLHLFAMSQRPQVEVLLKNLSFASPRPEDPIADVIKWLRLANQTGHSGRTVAIAKNALDQIRRLNERLEQICERKEKNEERFRFVFDRSENIGVNDEGQGQISQESSKAAANPMIIRTMKECLKKKNGKENCKQTVDNAGDPVGLDSSPVVHNEVVNKQKIKELQIELKYSEITVNGSLFKIYR